jgi:hypothetical protein
MIYIRFLRKYCIYGRVNYSGQYSFISPFHVINVSLIHCAARTEVFEVQRLGGRSPPLSLTLSGKKMRLDNSQKHLSPSAVSLPPKQVMELRGKRNLIVALFWAEFWRQARRRRPRRCHSRSRQAASPAHFVKQFAHPHLYSYPFTDRFPQPVPRDNNI